MHRPVAGNVGRLNGSARTEASTTALVAMVHTRWNIAGDVHSLGAHK
jgi:hypothetical protein